MLQGGFFLARHYVKAVIGLVVGVANGLFGSGGGTILVPAMQKFLKIETHRSHSSALAVIFPLSLLSITFYMRAAQTPWAIILWISVGGVVGGFIGAKILNKINATWLHKLFGLFMLAAATRMIFSS